MYWVRNARVLRELIVFKLSVCDWASVAHRELWHLYKTSISREYTLIWNKNTFRTPINSAHSKPVQAFAWQNNSLDKIILCSLEEEIVVVIRIIWLVFTRLTWKFLVRLIRTINLITILLVFVACKILVLVQSVWVIWIYGWEFIWFNWLELHKFV